MRCVSTKMHTVSVSHIDGCSDVDGRSGLNLSKGNRLMWPSSEQVGFVAVRIGSVLSCGSGELNPASIYRLKLFHLVPASVVIFFGSNVANCTDKIGRNCETARYGELLNIRTRLQARSVLGRSHVER